MKKRWLIGLVALVPACAPSAQTTMNTQQLPAATDYGPHDHLMEWWYVSSYLPEEGLALHWAQFKVKPPSLPLPILISHVAVTDLRTGKVDFIEQSPGLGKGTVTYPPLTIDSGGWTFKQQKNEPLSAFVLNAGPLRLTLTPLKTPVIHPPGYSGSAETGLLYYQGITRLALAGQVNGRDVQGLAWLDHQWGNQTAGQGAVWDWMSIQLSGGEDLMVYRVKTPAGKVVQTIGSIVDRSGVAHAATNLILEPGRVWKGSQGREYVLSWKVKADEFDLNVDAVNDAQELLSKSTRIAYWEGPIKVSGLWRGQSETGHGMMELVAGTLN